MPYFTYITYAYIQISTDAASKKRMAAAAAAKAERQSELSMTYAEKLRVRKKGKKLAKQAVAEATRFATHFESEANSFQKRLFELESELRAGSADGSASSWKVVSHEVPGEAGPVTMNDSTLKLRCDLLEDELSAAERTRLQVYFDLVDMDESESLDRNELGTVLILFGESPGEALGDIDLASGEHAIDLHGIEESVDFLVQLSHSFIPRLQRMKVFRAAADLSAKKVEASISDHVLLRHHKKVHSAKMKGEDFTWSLTRKEFMNIICKFFVLRPSVYHVFKSGKVGAKLCDVKFIQKLRWQWDAADTSADGQIGNDELQALLSVIGAEEYCRLNEVQIAYVLHKLQGHDGVLDWCEFLIFISLLVADSDLVRYSMLNSALSRAATQDKQIAKAAASRSSSDAATDDEEDAVGGIDPINALCTREAISDVIGVDDLGALVILKLARTAAKPSRVKLPAGDDGSAGRTKAGGGEGERKRLQRSALVLSSERRSESQNFENQKRSRCVFTIFMLYCFLGNLQLPSS